MPSLVSEFLINPVLRQARRFSSGFATEEPPTLQHQRTRSAEDQHAATVDDAILEEDGERNGRTPRSISATYTTRALEERLAQLQAQLEADTTRRLRDVPDRPTTAPSVSQQHQTARHISPQIPWVDEPGRSTPLPEDDGNGDLRRRILAIQAMDVPQNLKAQLMHQTLMEGYLKSRTAPPTSPTLHPESPTSRSLPDRPEPSGPLQQALKFWNPLSDGSEPLDLPLTEMDLRKTYVPSAPPTDDLAEQIGRIGIEDHGQPLLGCEHYRRNVKMQCATCEKWYTCRFCHDAVEDHILPRRETKHMLCMLCGCPQNASDTCVRCGESAAYYFCKVCKLWNDDPNKPIYHCNDCGLCRVGQGLGKDFFHCKKCMACISMTGGHKCIERSIDCDCPICGEYMFNSPRPVIFMLCGHSIHRTCFNEHMQTSYKCPLCNKSCVNMDAQFRNYDMAILTQPMPPEYLDARAIISCNDCSAKSQTAYHWLGLKCTNCNSYNTIQLQLLNLPGQESPESTADLMARRRPIQRPERVDLREQLRLRIIRDRAERASTAAAGEPSALSRLLLPSGLARSVSPDPSLSSLPPPASPPPTSRTAATNLETLTPTTLTPSNPMASSSAPAVILPTTITGRGLIAVATGSDDLEADDDDEDQEEEEDMLDFWGRSGDDARVTAGGEGEDDEDEESESGSDDDSDGCDEEDEDEDEEEEIVLFGHR